MRLSLLACLIAIISGSAVCSAKGQISEIRFGVAEFSESFINPGTEVDNGVEQSLALQGEVIFDEPEFLKWALSPQPYINGTLNLEENTNLVGAGLLWRQTFGSKFYGDFAGGIVIHDGTTKIERDTTTDLSEYFERLRNEREFGERILFRAQVSLGVRISEHWASEVFFEHVSNGSAFGRKPEVSAFLNFPLNDAADTLGVRAARRF